MMTGARKLFATVFKAVCLLIVVFARHSVAGEYTRQFFAVSGSIIMVALCNRADHYILPCSFFLLSSSFFLSSQQYLLQMSPQYGELRPTSS